jgi:hypothetical protein
VRVLLASLLVAGAVALVAVSQPGSLLIALLVMLVVFLAGAARLAVDLIELVPGELVADVALLVVIGVALGLVPLGNARLTALLFVLGIATQAVPVLLARSTRTTGS